MAGQVCGEEKRRGEIFDLRSPTKSILFDSEDERKIKEEERRKKKEERRKKKKDRKKGRRRKERRKGKKEVKRIIK